jgi:hypothetical protein
MQHATSFPKLRHSAIAKNLKLLPFHGLETQKKFEFKDNIIVTV